jgi:hypothetical protein
VIQWFYTEQVEPNSSTTSDPQEEVIMTAEKERPIGKISYEKPTALDLGPTAPVVGASCVPGEGVDGGACSITGNTARVLCETTGAAAIQDCLINGLSAGERCLQGQSP